MISTGNSHNFVVQRFHKHRNLHTDWITYNKGWLFAQKASQEKLFEHSLVYCIGLYMVVYLTYLGEITDSHSSAPQHDFWETILLVGCVCACVCVCVLG